MGNDTELQPASSQPEKAPLSDMSDVRLKPDSGIGLTQGLDMVNRNASGEALPPNLSMRTRMALSVVAPYWNRMTRWMMFSIIVIVVSLDLNARFDGFIGSGIEWVRSNVLSTYPSLAFIFGMFVCWYLAIRARNKE